MRILQVCPRYPPHTGGVETHVKEISERLVDRGHEVTVLTADAGPNVPAQATRNGVYVRRHRGLAPGGAFHMAPGIVRSLKRTHADLVHAHNYHSLPVYLSALGVDDQRFVITPHYHGASPNPVRQGLLALYRPFGRWALRRADVVIAVSNWERDQLRVAFGIDPVLVPHGLDEKRFADPNPVSRDRPFLLTVGRLEAYKGVQHVIRALPELPGHDLLVAGSGPYLNALEEEAHQCGVTDRVEFLGHVPDDRLPELYAGAAAYLQLSSFEAYGLTVGEALASGTPCVVRDEMALGGWTTTEGVVGVESMDPEVVRAAIEQAVSLPPPDIDLPTWEDQVRQLEELYQRSPDEKG